jgi:hypothetical protein
LESEVFGSLNLAFCAFLQVPVVSYRTEVFILAISCQQLRRWGIK